MGKESYNRVGTHLNWNTKVKVGKVGRVIFNLLDFFFFFFEVKVLSIRITCHTVPESKPRKVNRSLFQWSLDQAYGNFHSVCPSSALSPSSNCCFVILSLV